MREYGVEFVTELTPLARFTLDTSIIASVLPENKSDQAHKNSEGRIEGNYRNKILARRKNWSEPWQST